jgi:predicted transglutaminase-like cysteine proteinase
MRLSLCRTFCAVFITFAASPSAFAAGPGGVMRDYRETVERVTEGGFALAPFAAVKFCLANQDQCRDTGGDQIVELTADRRDEMLAVNSGINRSIKPLNDGSNSDVWSVDVNAGDCEDYALTKRKHLLELGWPSRALRIAVAKTPTGEGHAVLLVKTSVGDLVLDNRTSQVREWKRTDLRWIMMQSSQNPKIWVNVGGGSKI